MIFENLSKMASQKVEFCLKKKTARAQIFRYFRYESRNNKAHLLYSEYQMWVLTVDERHCCFQFKLKKYSTGYIFFQ